MSEKRTNVQIIWGIALLLMGMGVFFRIPQVMPVIEQMDQYAPVLPYIRFCLYFMGVFLAAAGIKKIYDHVKTAKP